MGPRNKASSTVANNQGLTCARESTLSRRPMNAVSDEEQQHKKQKTSVRNGTVGIPPKYPVRGGHQLSRGDRIEVEESGEDEEEEENVDEERRNPSAVPRKCGFSQDSEDAESEDGCAPLPVTIERRRITGSQAINMRRSDPSSQSSSLTTSEASGSPPIGKIAGVFTLFC